MIDVTLYTDPACPFAFSAEPARLRLRWHYGDGLRWRLKMIVLTLEPGEADKLAGGAPSLQARYGMPIHPFPYPRAASSEPACRAVVAARLHAPGSEHRLLRALRVRTMNGGLLDDPALIAASARDTGLDPDELRHWPPPRSSRSCSGPRRRSAPSWRGPRPRSPLERTCTGALAPVVGRGELAERQLGALRIPDHRRAYPGTRHMVAPKSIAEASHPKTAA